MLRLISVKVLILTWLCRVYGVCVTYRRVLVSTIEFIDTLYMPVGTMGNHSAIANHRTLQFSVANTHGQCFWTAGPRPSTGPWYQFLSGPRLVEKKFTGPRSDKGWEPLH
jgi:hypothetical protein